MNEQKQAVADCMNRLYCQGLTTTSGGNISLRISGDLILLTPSATDKGNMTAEQIAAIGMDGTNHTPHLKPSIETSMHLEIYKQHPHVEAIVHAHPPMASTFVAARKPINVRLIAEAYAIVGDPEYAPYELMGTDKLADSVAGSFKKHTCCVLMENHGVLCTGKTLLQAFDRIEVLENIAKINLNIGPLGGGIEMTADQLRDIDAMMGRNG
ncbi:class II aldolase/adducin family protein [Pontiella sulfatireligans]|uniref:Methylthioribulose-1-phosphate dehydratase n=1 Tax=Pontiella sulfatireligans TaxID=2750658 RepID=A0A6C2UQ24_9BACT|nr:class II aldolase/adducin family protein [Pontiella sulfatireligans]VGO22033.1 Methylthioribulose-1-phosphate dehydratase [Pontiella sulfatireligans]